MCVHSRRLLHICEDDLRQAGLPYRPSALCRLSAALRTACGEGANLHRAADGDADVRLAPGCQLRQPMHHYQAPSISRSEAHAQEIVWRVAYHCRFTASAPCGTTLAAEDAKQPHLLHCGRVEPHMVAIVADPQHFGTTPRVFIGHHLRDYLPACPPSDP